MEEYIKKSTLVEELEKRIKETESMQPKFDQFWAGQISAFKGILKIINTLEVKEVDLEIEQRMKECPYRQVGCTMYNGCILECRGACSWVVDYPKLKEFKAQKGEQGMKANTPIDFFSVHSREEVAEIDKRIERYQKEYDAKLRDKMMKAKDFPMTD